LAPREYLAAENRILKAQLKGRLKLSGAERAELGELGHSPLPGDQDRIADLGRPGSWPEILADLDSLTETEVEQDGKRFLLRSAPCPAASLALRAVGVALPPTVRQAAEA
jgi:hypothetical protein